MTSSTEDLEGQIRSAVASLGLEFEVIPCDPALADTAEFCAYYGYPEDHSANTIVVASKRPPGRHAACVVLATTRLDVNGAVRRRLDVRKVSFAPAELTMQLTGMAIGGVTPFGLPVGMPLWVDARVMDLDWVILGGGSRSMKLRVPPAALAAAGGEVVHDLALPV